MPGETSQLSAHDAAMVKVVDDLHAQTAAQVGAAPDDLTKVALGAQAPVTPPAATRPENVPEQFWDASKGAVNMEALLAAATAVKQEPAPATEGEKPAEQTTEQKSAEEAVKAAKLDMSTLRSEVDSKGDLTPESYAKLEAAGFDKATVQQFIAGQQAVTQLIVNEALALAGGQEAYTAMTQWAAANLPKAEQASFNAALGGDPATRKQAITALKAQYTEAAGSSPALLQGNTSGNSGEQPYASRAEVVAAMRDPKYASDPAYRALVARRVDAMDSF